MAEGTTAGLNARQVMYALKWNEDEHTLEDFPIPMACSVTPPEEPNVYTNGSLKKARFQAWAMGGFGIWWPGRRLEGEGRLMLAAGETAAARAKQSAL